MSLRRRVRSLERQVGRDRRPGTLQDMTDWELATLVAEHTGRTPAEVMALSGAELLALAGLSAAEVFGGEAP
jgi:hypothetical protein